MVDEVQDQQPNDSSAASEPVAPANLLDILNLGSDGPFEAHILPRLDLNDVVSLSQVSKNLKSCYQVRLCIKLK